MWTETKTLPFLGEMKPEKATWRKQPQSQLSQISKILSGKRRKEGYSMWMEPFTVAPMEALDFEILHLIIKSQGIGF